jgi:hypothetical protein
LTAILGADRLLSSGVQYFTFDVIGDLAFAEPFGCLKTGKYHPWIDFTFEVIIAGTYKRAADYWPLV